MGRCRSHNTGAKEPSEECRQNKPPACPQLQLKKKKNNFDAPYHDEYPSQALICAMMLRGETGAAEPRRGRGVKIVAAFDLKVASPLPVLRDPWRTRTALI